MTLRVVRTSTAADPHVLPISAETGWARLLLAAPLAHTGSNCATLSRNQCDTCPTCCATCGQIRRACGGLPRQPPESSRATHLPDTVRNLRRLVDTWGDVGRLADTSEDSRILPKTREYSWYRLDAGCLSSAVRGADDVVLMCPHVPSVAPMSPFAYTRTEKRVRTVNLLRRCAAGLHKAARNAARTASS
jgi:hypothetical protein